MLPDRANVVIEIFQECRASSLSDRASAGDENTHKAKHIGNEQFSNLANLGLVGHASPSCFDRLGGGRLDRAE